MRKLTREGPLLEPRRWGKTGRDGRPEVAPPGRQTRQGESFAPLANDLPGCVSAHGNYVVRQALRCQKDDLSSNHVSIR